MLMAVPRQWQQRFVVVLGKLTMDVSRGFGGKFTRMCFGSGISSSTSGTAKGSIYSLWLSFVYVSGARSSKGRHMSLVMTI